MIARRSESGLDQEGAELVAVQTQRPGLIVDLGPANVEGRVPLDELFLFAVAVEAGQGGQTPGDGGAHPAGLFHPAAEQLEMGSTDREQRQAALVAPGGEDPQIGGVAGPGGPAVAGEEPGNGRQLGPADRIVDDEDDLTSDGLRHDALLRSPGTGWDRETKNITPTRPPAWSYRAPLLVPK
jgi:hypothetical protein